ncbi:MAG: monomethylamine:corrinoid methyltransferase, partial [Chloroflexota bacterium]
ADGNAPNCSGLEARWMAECALASHRMKMSLKEANDRVLELLPRYEHVFTQDGNPGLPFDQVYDLQTIQPKDFWLAMYEEVKTELKDMGLKV